MTERSEVQSEIALRVVGVAGAHRDVILDAPPGATMADVAVALAADFGGPVRSLFLGPDRLDPTMPMCDASIGDGDIVGWGRPAPASPTSSVVLRVTAGPDCGRRFTIGSSVLVGRGGSAEINLRDPSVSRCHAVVAPTGDGLEVRNVAGKNGVRVSGKPLVTGIVAIGEEVQIGATTLRAESAATVPAPARWGRGRVDVAIGARPDGSVVDLRLDASRGDVVVAGDRPAAVAAARAVVVQLMSAPPAEAQLFVLAPRDPGAWRWLLWLPEVRRPAGQPWRVASRPLDVAARVADLEEALHARQAAVGRPDNAPIVVLCDGVEAMPSTDRLRREGPRHGIYVLTVTDSAPERVPVGTHVLVVSHDAVSVRSNDETIAAAVGCRVDVADAIARHRLRGSHDKRRPTFAQLIAARRTADDRRLPVGFDDVGSVIEIDLDAGTILVERDTDEGTIEVLRTLVASAAASHSSADLAVFVVDSGNELADLELLPHCDWRVSKLDHAVVRAVAAVARDRRALVVIDDFDEVHATDPRLVAALVDVAADPQVMIVWSAAPGVTIPASVVERCGARLTPRPAGRGHWLHHAGGTTAVCIPSLPPLPAVAGTRASVPRVTRLDIGALTKRRPKLAHHRGSVATLAESLSAVTPPRVGKRSSVGPAVRVLIVEDHVVLAEAMRATLEVGGCSVTAVATDVDGALAAISASRIDVAVVDVDLTGADRSMPGADVVDALRDAVPDLPLVVVTRHGRPSAAVAGRVASRRPEAFLPAGSGGEQLTETVRAVASGQAVGSSALPVSGGRAFGHLTAAEQRVLVELARQPDTRARLARRLHLSISTVDSHLRAIKQKVGDELAADGLLPGDGIVSTEALIGWAIAHGYDRMPTGTTAVTL